MDIDSRNKSGHVAVRMLFMEQLEICERKRDRKMNLGKWTDFKIACAEGRRI